MNAPAKSIDSYKNTLMKVLEKYKPEHVIEFGSGESTRTLGSFPSIKYLRTVEHDDNWLAKAKALAHDNTEVIYEPELSKYSCEFGDHIYDFVFVDGRFRKACLYNAKAFIHDNSIVMLHDAERGRYRDGIERYRFKIFTDNGNTCTMTDNESVYKELEELLCNG